jgi:hypothetical protein
MEFFNPGNEYLIVSSIRVTVEVETLAFEATDVRLSVGRSISAIYGLAYSALMITFH